MVPTPWRRSRPEATAMSRTSAPHPPVVEAAPAPEVHSDGPAPPKLRVRVKKTRLLAVLIPLALLAGISALFGMMMAVAADLPALEQLPQVAKRKNSILYDIQRRPLTMLTSNDGRVIVSGAQISQNVKYAVVAIEDARFYTNEGVDLRGIARAAWQDVIAGSAVQGASTIAQQFVKNATKAQGNRTIMEKAREAALAFHLTRRWSKDRILTEYLNSVYFGNGAYGIEAAARTYFASAPGNGGCGEGNHPSCASLLDPAQAAMLAAIIASPSGYDPIAHPVAAKARRDMVLRKMLEQQRISGAEYDAALPAPIPTEADLMLPRLETPDNSEYFVSWVRQSLVDHVGPQRAFEGNLRVKTTLDLDFQRAAEKAINAYVGWSGGPSAALVAIDNQTGEVRAMVGGRDYNAAPFNLATQGQRQPGSAFKPFTLAEALTLGIGPGTVFPSRKRVFAIPDSKPFVVRNFDNKYLGSASIATALTYSDNSVFAALGLKIGTKRIARRARAMGIRTPVSTNPSMTLGGLHTGVTAVDMAHAYETFATGGLRVGGTLGTSNMGPVGIDTISRVLPDGKLKLVDSNERRTRRVLSAAVAQTATNLLTGPVQSGSATRAQYGGFAAGKTGTTENSGDAWFVGFTRRWTIAVWVGYPNGLRPMLTEFEGQPVTGGTFPALIWRAFVLQADQIVERRKTKAGGDADASSPGTTTFDPEAATGGGEGSGSGTTGGADGTSQDTAPDTPEKTPSPSVPKTQAKPAPSPAPAPKPEPSPAPTPTPTPTPPANPPGSGGGAAPSG